MPSFEKTTIWQAAFAARGDDQHSQARSFLRSAFLKFRERVGILVSTIAKDLPDLTVHTISHLDALWETASLIAGKDYRLNPCEAFVLGGAILLHDAGMSLASYPQGIEDLKKTVEWRDAVAIALRSDGYEGDLASIKIPPETERQAIGEVLRLRHAQHASELATQKWRSPDGNEEFLIEDGDLRRFYGPTIGAVAGSHWDPAQLLDVKLPKLLGAIPKVPADWEVDPVKLACLLRVADATHIDERRAPHFLRTVVRPQGISDEHWSFQEKLGQPQAQGDAIVFTSGPEFSIGDADAWWRCFDTLQMIDAELKAVNLLLENLGKQEFALRRVMAAESPRGLAQYIRTRGWEPVDARLVISDVPGVVRLLGGKHLYGDDPTITIRELIQNATDAIRARRVLEKEATLGRILVRRRKTESSVWLEIEDDGIGMSERVLTGPLLDFGNSFWSGPTVREEFPGLIAEGMQPTGKFGVGFFSVFMLGDVVTVTSRRFDHAADSARTLEFRGGLDARPILHQPNSSQTMLNGGTRVSVKLEDANDDERNARGSRGFLRRASMTSLASLVAGICPDLDVDVAIQVDGKEKASVRSGDWVSMPSERLLRRILASDASDRRQKDLRIYASIMRELKDSDGRLYGRACIAADPSLFSFDSLKCAVTVGGLIAAYARNLAGVLIGSTEYVTRNIAMPSVPAAVLESWAVEQSKLLAAAGISDEKMMASAGVVMLCGAGPGDLPIAKRGDEYVNISTLRDQCLEADEVRFIDEEIDYDEDVDDCHPRDFRESFERNDNFYLIPSEVSGLLDVAGQRWPDCIRSTNCVAPRSPKDAFMQAIADAWKCGVGELRGQQEENFEVGDVLGTPILRDVILISREN